MRRGGIETEAATVAAELAELCRTYDWQTLMLLFEMAAVEAAEADDARRPERRRPRARAMPETGRAPAVSHKAPVDQVSAGL